MMVEALLYNVEVANAPKADPRFRGKGCTAVFLPDLDGWFPVFGEATWEADETDERQGRLVGAKAYRRLRLDPKWVTQGLPWIPAVRNTPSWRFEHHIRPGPVELLD